MPRKSTSLEKLFGSRSRVGILKTLLNNDGRQMGVNEIIRKSGINARLVSTELRKMAEIGVLVPENVGNSLLYRADLSSPLVKPLMDLLEEREWTEWSRPARIHHLMLTMEAGLDPMEAYYGYSFPYSHMVFDFDNVTIFYKQGEFAQIGELLVPIYLERKSEIWSDFNRFASTLWSHHDYLSFYKNYIDFWKVAYVAEPLSYYVESMLRPGEQITISEKSFTQEYEDEIWKLAKEAQDSSVERINVEPLVKEYFWIRNNFHDVHTLTEEEVRAEVRKRVGVKRPGATSVPTDPASISPELLQIGKDMIMMQDQRKKYMMKAAYYLLGFLKNEGAKYGLTPDQMLQTLPNEVLAGKEVLGAISEELDKRERACTVTCDLKDGIRDYSGKIIYPPGYHRRSKYELRGRVACGGSAVGRARVVRGLEDTNKVNHGDVIISPMTTPDLMPAIRRCVGIITDFGGITCHAAIVAREFNIPCIVGTNNATEVIKDDDLVEVDANNGVVRVLQSNS